MNTVSIYRKQATFQQNEISVCRLLSIKVNLRGLDNSDVELRHKQNHRKYIAGTPITPTPEVTFHGWVETLSTSAKNVVTHILLETCPM